MQTSWCGEHPGMSISALRVQISVILAVVTAAGLSQAAVVTVDPLASPDFSTFRPIYGDLTASRSSAGLVDACRAHDREATRFFFKSPWHSDEKVLDLSALLPGSGSQSAGSGLGNSSSGCWLAILGCAGVSLCLNHPVCRLGTPSSSVSQRAPFPQDRIRPG